MSAIKLAENDYDLVFLPSGRRAHILLWTNRIFTVCGRDCGLWNDDFLGCGDQREYDRAASMQLCKRCQDMYFEGTV